MREVLAGQLVLAPLTRGGNLPYRRLCAELGAKITFSEMALARNLIRGKRGELALLRKHESEACFGVQLAARQGEEVIKAAALAVEKGAAFIDVNLGCPIDSMRRRGIGAALLEKPKRVERLLAPLAEELSVPFFVKVRTGYKEGKENVLRIAGIVEEAGAAALTVHGRTREQRYRRPANWELIAEVADSVNIPVIGNGDILSAEDARRRLDGTACTAVMAARGALVAPWIFEDFAQGECRPRSAEERLVVMRRWVELAVEAWGGDEFGFRRICNFLEFHVEWWKRYVPSDAELSAEPGLQNRVVFEARCEIERTLQAEGEGGNAKACALILEPFDVPPTLLDALGGRADASAGGWS